VEKFKIGNTVRCVRHQWAGGKYIEVGYVGKVTHVTERCLAVDNILNCMGAANCSHNAFELVKEETKQMKPTDKISVEITLAELAKIYALTSKASGSTVSLYELARSKIDPDGKRKAFMSSMKGADVLRYHEYQGEFLSLMFPEPVEQKTPQQIQIEALQETIDKAAMQIKLLKEGN
jgi:hypothetical protein